MRNLRILPLAMACTLSICAYAQDTRYQKNSERATEETIEERDGKVVRKTRSGQVQSRQGSARVGDIEDSEITQVERRQRALRLYSFGFGPFWSNNVGKSNLLYGFSAGRHWEVSTTGEVFWNALAALNSKGQYVNSTLGFSWLPLTTEVSPILGAGLGFGAAHGNTGSTRGGFVGELRGGARFFRTSNVQMEILGTYSTLIKNSANNVYGLQLRVLF